jgi:hypothetical protein
LIVLSAVVAGACVADPGIEITVYNDSSRPVCVGAPTVVCGHGVAPAGSHDKVVVLCTSSMKETITVTVAGEEIYRRTATCGEWKKSGAWIRVTEVNGALIVSDSLTASPTPSSGRASRTPTA